MFDSAERWEHGSEFHWLGPGEPGREPAVHPWSGRGVLFGSGRDALRALLRHGSSTLGWRRVFVPSFLCQEVVSAVASEGLVVEAYLDDPRAPIGAPCPGPDGAVIVVNTFGVRSRWLRPAGCSGAVIEDHTHDPWSEWARTSEADYCIASLRKTLPIPGGGVLWSPPGRLMPGRPGLTGAHHAAASQKLEAMVLKALFLAGHAVEKETFRALAVSGEEGLATHEVSAVDPVSAALSWSLDATTWRERRRGNHALLAARLGAVVGIEVVEPGDPGSCPFSAILVCRDAHTRDRLRQRLIMRRIYPAVLWPLERCAIVVPAESVALSRRVLSLHCDGRYGGQDMERVAGAVAECLT